MTPARYLLAATAIIVLSALFAVVALAETGNASWYGAESGSHRADGKRFNPNHVLCAHRTLKLGTIVRVTRLSNGRSIECPILDRGPARWTGRVIDLSLGAARKLGMVRRGVVRVRVVVVR